MRIGVPAWAGAPWPVEEKTFKSEFVSHWRTSFYRKVFTGWKTVGMFTTEAEAQHFIDAKASEVTS